MFQPSTTRKIVDKRGMYTLVEYERDLSVSPESAATAYFTSKMNVRKRQVVANMDGTKGVILQAGAMQMMMGDIQAAINIKGAGDLMRKFVGSKVTGESAVKPKYVGYGLLILEPTYRYILFEDLARWNGNMVIEDGMFLACDDTIDLRVVARTNLSSAVLGNEGLFSSCLTGHGLAVLESPVPAEELLVIDVENDTVRIDGSMAIAWSNTLEFKVERTTATLIGSAASGEGLVNVYRGNGRILVAPVANNRWISVPKVGK